MTTASPTTATSGTVAPQTERDAERMASFLAADVAANVERRAHSRLRDRITVFPHVAVLAVWVDEKDLCPCCGFPACMGRMGRGDRPAFNRPLPKRHTEVFYTYNRGFPIREANDLEVSRVRLAATHDAGERGRA